MSIEVTGYGPVKAIVGDCEAGKALILTYKPNRHGFALLNLAEYEEFVKKAKLANISIVPGPASYAESVKLATDEVNMDVVYRYSGESCTFRGLTAAGIEFCSAFNPVLEGWCSIDNSHFDEVLKLAAAKGLSVVELGNVTL